jgi:FkbM family methyltransferase
MRLPVSLRSGLRATERRLGFEVNRRRSDQWLQQIPIATIIDVGSNIGQFAARSRLLYPNSQIYAFEPLADCFAQLTHRFSGDKKFAGFRVALGAAEGTSTFHRNDYSPSSSLLEMEKLHEQTFTYTRAHSQVSVPVRRLDAVLPELDLKPDILLKLDVQGFEDRVLDGAQELLRQTRVVISEVSFEALYKDQAQFEDIYRRLTAAGFRYHGNWEQLFSPVDGRVLQADAIFLRP